jgi:hypothetical protein
MFLEDIITIKVKKLIVFLKATHQKEKNITRQR